MADQSSVERCPICGGELKPGYIQSRDGLGWSEKKCPVSALSAVFASIELGSVVRTGNCPQCKKLFLDYVD